MGREGRKGGRGGGGGLIPGLISCTGMTGVHSSGHLCDHGNSISGDSFFVQLFSRLHTKSVQYIAQYIALTYMVSCVGCGTVTWAL